MRTQRLTESRQNLSPNEPVDATKGQETEADNDMKPVGERLVRRRASGRRHEGCDDQEHVGEEEENLERSRRTVRTCHGEAGGENGRYTHDDREGGFDWRGPLIVVFPEVNDEEGEGDQAVEDLYGNRERNQHACTYISFERIFLTLRGYEIRSVERGMAEAMASGPVPLYRLHWTDLLRRNEYASPDGTARMITSVTSH